jgi:hypothetical protein
MQAIFKKTRKAHVKLSFKELYQLAEKYNPSKYVYVTAPYSMGKDEFFGYYAKYYIIFPSMPSWDDLSQGIKNVTGQTMLKFFTN